MDWCIDGDGPGVAGGAEQIEAYFRRHALPADWVDIRAGVIAALETAAGGSPFLWARVDWDGPDPELVVRGIARPSGTIISPGVRLANSVTAALSEVSDGVTIKRTFPLAREPESDLDASPVLLRPDSSELTREAFLAAVALSGSADDAPSDPAARAAQAGAELSVAALAAYLRSSGGDRPATAAEAAAAFMALQHSAGADFYLLEADDRRAVLANRRCPFGPGVTAAPMMCRCTSAVLGRLGAEVEGTAWVTMPERIALGDPECRAVLDVGTTQPSPISHRYVDPPAGLDLERPRRDGRPITGDPRVVLSLLLPRDTDSVPVVRHMCEQVVGALGATADAVGDLSVALTEACSNVVRHAVDGDDFRVEVELGGDQCEIVVSYRDAGFNPLSVGVDAADAESESGRGLLLMRALVDELDFTFDPGHTSVRMVKQLDFAEERPIQKLLRPRDPD